MLRQSVPPRHREKGIETGLRRLCVGQDDRVDGPHIINYRGGEIGDDRPAAAAAAIGSRIDDAAHLDRGFAGAQNRDLCKIAGAVERDIAPAERLAMTKERGAIVARAPEEIERIS